MPRLRVIYDGQCPFCSRYVRLVRLRQHYEVELVDAREHPRLARGYGLDLDEGMIVDLDGAVYHGADAIWLVSTLSSRSGLVNRIAARILSSRRVAGLLYPAMRAGRNATLAILGRSGIG